MEKGLDPVRMTWDPEEEVSRKGECEYCGKPLEDQVWLSITPPGQKDNGSVQLTCHRCDVHGTYNIELNDFMERPVEWLVHLSEKNRLSAETAFRFLRIMRKVTEFIF